MTEINQGTSTYLDITSEYCDNFECQSRKGNCRDALYLRYVL